MKATVLKFIFATAILLNGIRGFSAEPEFRGYWVDVFHPGFLNATEITNLVNTMRAANCNAIIAEVRARANAYYNGSPYEPKGPGITPSNFDPLAELLAQGHDTSNGKQRLEIHAWLVTYKTSGTQPPDWMHKRNDGVVSTTEYDPGHPKAQERVFNVAMDILNRYDIDGLNFDYVRYPENAQLGPSVWGFNDVTVARFNSRFGRTGIPDVNDPVWNQFRRDQVTALVRKIYLHVMATKPWVKVSVDAITWNPSPISDASWTNSSRAYNDVLQDWRGWMEEGIIDYSIPMNYYRHGVPSFAADYVNWMNFAKDHQYGRQTIIGPGVYMNFATNVINQMRMTREPSPNGNYAVGVCGYSYAVSVTNSPVSPAEMFQALVQPSAYDTNPVPIFAERAEIPAMPWKVAPTKGHLKGFIVGAHPTNFLDGAAISISGPMNREFISDATGFFGSVDLPPGDYSLTASFTNYTSVTTNFSVTAGDVTTRDLILATNSPPIILSQPTDQTVFSGTNVTFSVVATGSEPLIFQWKRNGTNITGATESSFTINNVTTNDGGMFSVIITNHLGITNSDTATLIVHPPAVVTGTTLLWELNQDSSAYFTTNHAERGLAYNPATGNLLFIGRTPTNSIFVLNGDTGEELHTMTVTTNVSVGTYPIMMLGVADDGAVYAGNLSLNNETPFRLYRWENDSTSSVPTIAFSGDPGLGNNQRWGDTMDVRGSGTNTQVLLASRLGNIVCILTTTNGVDFSANVVSVPAVANGAFGLGIAFGSGNTFWGKAMNSALYEISFDLANGTGTVVRTIDDPDIPNSIAPIGFHAGLNLLAGIHWDTPDNLKLYDCSISNVPPLLTSANYESDNPNTFFVGSVDFGVDRVYALNGNNGILALKLKFAPAPAPVINKVEVLSDGRFGLWFNAERRPYKVLGSSDLVNWEIVSHKIPQDGLLEFEDAQTDARFYRLITP